MAYLFIFHFISEMKDINTKSQEVEQLRERINQIDSLIEDEILNLAVNDEQRKILEQALKEIKDSQPPSPTSRDY